MKHNKFTSINHLRTIISEVKSYYQFKGIDENGNAIIDTNAVLPTLTFKGTVKIHGTNAGIGFDGKDYWMQSRTNILDIKNNNAGFYNFGMNAQSYVLPILSKIYDESNFDAVMVYGEFCGQSIQKGVAVSELTKRFIVFDVVGIIHTKDGHDKVHLNQYIDEFVNEEFNIYNVNQFETYNVTIDFQNPQQSINEIADIVDAVEKECPVGKKFGVEGIGEGVVFTHDLDNKTRFRFKAKGEKHSVTKVKKVVRVDVEKLNSVNEFVEYAVTRNRVLQASQSINVERSQLTSKHTGEIIKWVMTDIFKEEEDTLLENNLTGKDIGGAAPNLIRKFYFELLDEIAVE